MLGRFKEGCQIFIGRVQRALETPMTRREFLGLPEPAGNQRRAIEQQPQQPLEQQVPVA